MTSVDRLARRLDRVERDIRIIALALGQDGVIEIEADVLPDRGERRS